MVPPNRDGTVCAEPPSHGANRGGQCRVVRRCLVLPRQEARVAGRRRRPTREKEKPLAKRGAKRITSRSKRMESPNQPGEDIFLGRSKHSEKSIPPPAPLPLLCRVLAPHAPFLEFVASSVTKGAP